MNGNGVETETLYDDDIDDATETAELETDEALESDGSEFLPFPFPPIPFPGRSRGPAPRRSYAPPAPFGQIVTQPALNAALTKVRNDIAKSSRAIGTLNTRVNGVQGNVTRHAKELAKLNKVNARQDRDIVVARREIKTGLKKAQDASLMMFLLTRPKATAVAPADITIGTGTNALTIEKDTKILVQPAKDNSMLFALLFSGAFGGSDGGGGSDMSSMVMMMALAGGGLF